MGDRTRMRQGDAHSGVRAIPKTPQGMLSTRRNLCTYADTIIPYTALIRGEARCRFTAAIS